MKRHKILLLVLLAVSAAVVAVCSFPAIFPFDETTSRLLCETLPRLSVAVFLFVLLLGSDYRACLSPRVGVRALLWCLPCFAVAIVNFPFTALIFGEARLERLDLLWLFLLKCVSVAAMEELFFRGLLLPFFGERFSSRRGGSIAAALISSALFSLMHLINLFYRASIGGTALQLGYTFLLGCMFAVMMFRTNNIWLCVLTHAVFDVGGIIVTDLGSGPFQDLTFWILTAVFGVLCAVHVVISALGYEKRRMRQ